MPKVPNKIATHGQKVDAVDSIPVSLAPSSSVCNWVLNSPFKDSSFGTSFVMPSGRSGVGTNYVEESDSELNNSSSADDSNSRVELFTEKTKKVVEFNNRSSDEDDEKTSADDPATKPATNVNPSLDSEKLIEESLNMESLKLRLEGSARSNGTAFTLGRIAESGKMAASSKNEIKVPSNVKTPRNVHLNLAHNFFVTERRKKKKTVQTESSERPSNTINDEMDKCETVKNEKREIASKTASASLKKVVVSSTDSSDSDELNEYMKKWRNDRKKVNKAADESLSAFITDDDSDGDVIAYNLPPLSERITTRAPFINRREYATSVSEFLSGNPNDSKTPAGRIEVRRAPAEQIYNLSDSDSSTPPCARNFKTRDVSVIVLSDSDDSDNELNHIEKPNTFRTPKPPHSKTNTFITTPKPPHSKPNTFITPKLPHSMPNNSFKTPTTPSRSKENSKHPKSHVLKKFANAEHGSHTLSFLASLSADSNTTRCHPDALVYMKNFNKNRQELTERLYKLFNSKIFENKLPDSMAITWNTRMTKTAGFCYYKVDRSKASGRNARVELSTKVVDSPARLRDTLVHELCHAAAWLVSGYHGGHGPVWQAWASRATRVFPELPSIARCHNYEIACKYQYQCTKCGYSIGRHSKSLDTERKVCGRCLGRFELLATSARKPTSATTGSQPAALRTPRTPGPFAIFVKENYGSVKKNSQDLKHADVMRILGEKFKEMKTV
ncbi:hypothetical protein HAZT_HAZT009297 [Hyalella azteca]|uniref:SprT-like domain-containing protein n=1 Tax=Hyalella azteca TaxID=294128 RepID=A0A6A0HDZ2_HYAAZ|nr:hypothetical protein HAZT_HAZT009297 [Hyalella azteca]